MPILYPSQSPISTAQLSQILPWRPSRASQLILGLIPVFLAVILIEILLVLGIDLFNQLAIIALVLLLTTVVFTAFRFGAYPGVVGSLVASAYIAYSMSPPGELFNYAGNTGINVVIISLLYLCLGLATGYMKERIDQSLFQVNIARAYAEEQQNRLESILSQLPIGVIISEAKTDQVVYHNEQGHILLDSNDIEPNDVQIAELIKTNTKSSISRTSHEIAYKLPNGQMSYWQVNVAPIYDSQQQQVSNVATFLEVTQQKEVERRKDDFISIASHELKTPVTSLKIYLQLMARQNIVKTNRELSDIVEKANNQINKLARLMSDLLDVSQIQTGKAGYQLDWLDLNHLVKDVVGSIKPSTDHTIIIKGEATKQVWADSEKITQVITNLLNNAIKYSESGKPITIILVQLSKCTKVSIQDLGVGIASSEQKRIFEQFYQVKKVASKTYSGLGIGLYICQQIIENHHGTIGVTSQPGEGSTFWFTLPNTQPEISN